KGGFDSAPFYGAGVGYQWNSWFRTDVTGEYRGKASFHALDRYFNAGYFTNDYSASKSEWVALVNAYIDLGTWWSITPYIGAGVGDIPQHPVSRSDAGPALVVAARADVSAGARPQRLIPKRGLFDSSCPRVSRASTSCFISVTKDVDGRDKPGHDAESVSIIATVGMSLRALLLEVPRMARKFSAPFFHVRSCARKSHEG